MPLMSDFYFEGVLAMDRSDKHISSDLARFRQEMAALRRRLRANAKKSKKLSSDTEVLIKRIKRDAHDTP